MGRLRRALGERSTIEPELGRGAMATVYLAQDRRHARPVAVKALSAQVSVRAERFLCEITVANRVNMMLTCPTIPLPAPRAVR